MIEDTEKITVKEQMEQWEACDARYVRIEHFWRWIVGVISGSVIILSSTIFALTRWGSIMEQADAMLYLRMTRVESTQEKIEKILDNQDTLKILIREFNK